MAQLRMERPASPGLKYALMLLVLSGWLVAAQVPAQTPGGWNGTVQTLTVPLYKSRIVQLPGPVQKVSVGNKEVADILVMRSNQVYVLGKGIGTTNVLLWDNRNNLTQSLDVEVTPDTNSLKAKLYELAPQENIRVHSSQGAIVLSGEVSNIGTMDTAVRLANSYLQKPAEEGASQIGEVINLLKVGGSQQVMLKVTVAEMSRTVMRRLGIKFHALDIRDNHWSVGGVSGGATFPDATFGSEGLREAIFDKNGLIGPAVDEFAPDGLSILDKGLFASYMDSNLLFQIAFDAAKENGSAKILAEPTLTTLTGQEAEFLSGGEFPIPVPQDDDGITIEFKEFGIGLRFLPVVLDSGKINLKLNVEVSELTGLGSVSLGAGSASSDFFVPALTKRSARSTVELGDGQTIGIAGLINENMRDVVNKFPGLGDVPVLGHLFRSQEFEKGESELVILVTPALAKPFVADNVALPGDGFVEPSDVEFYLLGRSHGTLSQAATVDGETAGSGSARSGEAPIYTGTGGAESTFGHSVN